MYPPSSCKRRHKSYQPSTSHVRHRFCQKLRGNACENYSNDGWLSFQDVESIVKTLASVVAIFGALIPGLANAFSLQVANQEVQRVEVFASPIHNSISIAYQSTIPPTKFPALLNTEQSTAAPQTLVDPNVQSIKSTPHKLHTSDAKTQTKTKQQSTTSGDFQPIDMKKIASENKIEVELVTKDQPATIKIDRDTFRKVKIIQPPFLQYLPSSVQPLISRQFQSMKVLKEIPNDQLFTASVIAGSLTEIIRTTVTYPLKTVKTRVQARTLRSTNRNRPLLRKVKVTWLTFVYETKRGDWYAGILPTLLVTIPASGVYSGVKEVSRRAFSLAIQIQLIQNYFPDNAVSSSYFKALIVNLLAALVADVASLVVRTPADILALRLQVFGANNVRSDFGEWAKDSLLLLPAMISTDLPYLMSRILLNAAVTTSGENLGRYELETIIIACLCAFLTTPFDVARTRILLPRLPSDETEEEQQRRRLVATSKYRTERREKLSVTKTMKRIAAEGNGGLQNLFSGWLERTVYLGFGRAWLDPLRVIGYLGIRDALLLKLFD